MNFTKILQKMKNHPYTVFSPQTIGVDVRKLRPHFDHLPNDKLLKELIEHPENKPMRQRAMMSYNIEFNNQGNLIRFHEFYELDSYPYGDQIEYAKLYDEFPEALVEDQVFKDFLYNALLLTWHLKKYRKAAVTCHAIRTVSHLIPHPFRSPTTTSPPILVPKGCNRMAWTLK